MAKIAKMVRQGQLVRYNPAIVDAPSAVPARTARTRGEHGTRHATRAPCDQQKRWTPRCFPQTIAPNSSETSGANQTTESPISGLGCAEGVGRSRGGSDRWTSKASALAVTLQTTGSPLAT